MKFNYIWNNLERFQMKKSVLKSKASVIKDSNTGDILEEEELEYGFYTREPDYIKVYDEYLQVLNDFNFALLPYLLAFCRKLTYADETMVIYQHVIHTGSIERAEVAGLCGVSDNRVKRAIRELVKCEVFIPVMVDGKKKKGLYFVNPWIVSRGQWKAVKKLRESFKSKDDITECYTYLDEKGKRFTYVSKYVDK